MFWALVMIPSASYDGHLYRMMLNSIPFRPLALLPASLPPTRISDIVHGSWVDLSPRLPLDLACKQVAKHQ